MSRRWANASACRLQVSMSCTGLPVYVQVVSPPLGWSRSSSFHVVWSPCADARGPSAVCEAVDVSSHITLHFSHITDYVCDLCPLPGPDVALAVLVCDVEHTYFHFANYTVFVWHTVTRGTNVVAIRQSGSTSI